jgi:hypothetical protein
MQIPQLNCHNMIINVTYRLAEYKIIENKDGSIWWETHSGFCSVKMGHCFVNGSVLFMESGHTSEEDGFLKGEYLDQLNRLPKWEKTKYYCTRFQIVKCKLDPEEKSPSANNTLSQPTTQDDVSYRLNQFEILEKEEGQLFWKSCSGRGTIKVGKGFVDDNILFLGPGVAEETGIIKKEFMVRLFTLSAWEKTNYFCQHYTLYTCETNTPCYEFGENVLPKKNEKDTVVFRKKSPLMKSNIRPITATGTITQNYLKTFWSFCSILFLFILKVLFWSIIILLKALKLFIEACARGGKRFLKWVFNFLNRY